MEYRKKNENTLSNSNSTDEDNLENKTESTPNIYKMQVQKNNNSIESIEDLNSNKINIIGLYDPEDNSLDIILG